MDWLGRARITNKKISYLCSSAVIRDSVGQREKRERGGEHKGERGREDTGLVELGRAIK